MPANPRIAIVDDDSSMRVSLARLLSVCGFHPVTFNSGEAFLKSQATHPVACVLLDLTMPGLSGFEVKEQLSKSHPQLAVILITAHADPQVSLKAKREGFVACLPKPFTHSQLIPLINRALRRTQSDHRSGA